VFDPFHTLTVAPARNILLFSLVIADTDGKHQQMIWNIYYHFYLDESSLKILNDQAKKLLSLSASMDAWHDTPYGHILRFCDLSTFSRVRALWRSYGMQDLNEKRRTAFNSLLEANIQRAKEVKAHYVGSENAYVTTGIRSAAPIGIAYAENAHISYQHYWKYGSTSHDPQILAKTNLPNPLFAIHTIGAPTLHYGTDPLLGFHLATAFAPVKDTLSASGVSTRTPALRVVEAAQLQFREWCHVFRSSSQTDLVIRFFAGDAIAFEHALHHLDLSGHNWSGNVYRDIHHLSPIELDKKEYNPTNGAPLTFNVIDTSNLIDHVGALNLLSATSPLLRSNMSSTLYTESLVKREKDHRAYIDSILCGDFATISLLLDLFPIEYWTNASSSSTADDVTFDIALRLTDSGDRGQMRVKLTWKRSGLLPNANRRTTERRLRFNETDLAHILHNVYRNMFQHENILSLFKDIDRLKIKRNFTLHYHRGSFVVFLRLLRNRVAVDWHDLMNRILELVENDSTITMGRNYIQELYLYLHTLNVYSAPIFTRTKHVEVPAAGGISGWKDLPETVCITLQVPRNMLTALTGPKPTDIGTPIGHCIVQSSLSSTVGRWQNIFSGIQITFGTMSTIGKIHSNDYAIQVSEDDLRWQGESPLVVSFRTPSWFLLLEPQTAIVALGLQSTPHTCTKFVRSFGVDMNIFEATLGNEECVYISRHPPNLTGTAIPHCSTKDEHISTEFSPEEFETTFSASVVQPESRITTLCGRMDFFSGRLRHSLRSGCAVKTKQTAPCDLAITFTGENAQILLAFPVPVCGNKSKTRIARKSAYIEIEAPLYGNVWTSFPVFSSSHVWGETDNVHHLDMRTLPILDHNRHSQLRWLSLHVASIFSGQERRLREQSMSTASALRPDARVSFKDSLFSLFMHFTGLQGRKAHVFGLDNPTGGGVHVLIFVSCMRLDLGSQTVVLDTAVLPLTRSLVPCIARFLSAVTERGFCHIKVDGEELQLWRQTLPSFAERCRVWHHHPACDHVTRLDQRTEDDINDVFCACSRGFLSEDFVIDVPNWADVAGLVTRAAISPIFSAPIVDPPFDGSLTSEPAQGGCTACGKGEAVDGGKLLKCSACHVTKYCSSSCQRSDWKSHKRLCRK
jgi:hypothetical protein